MLLGFRHFGFGVALVLAAGLVTAPTASAQDDQSAAELLANAAPAPDATPEDLEQFDTAVLVTLFDAVATAAEPAPEEAVAVEWFAHDMLRGGDGVTTIPFTVTIDRAALPAGDAVVYVAAVDTSVMPEPGEAPEPAWDAIWTATLDSNRFTRAMTVPPGEYEVFVSVKGRSADVETAAGPPFGVGRYTLSVPDYDSGDLSLSTLVRFSNVVPLPGQPTPEQLDADPYIFGTNRFIRKWDTNYGQAGDIAFIFWIYGADGDRNGVPELTIETDFNRVTADGTEPFTRMQPIEINSDNPPPFAASEGIAVPNGAPLASFEPGEYQMVITVNDERGDETVTEEFNFTVR